MVHASRRLTERAPPTAFQLEGDTPTIMLQGGAPCAPPTLGPLAQSGILILKWSNSPLLPHYPGTPRAVRCSVVYRVYTALRGSLRSRGHFHFWSRRPVARNQPSPVSMPNATPFCQETHRIRPSPRHRPASPPARRPASIRHAAASGRSRGPCAVAVLCHIACVDTGALLSRARWRGRDHARSRHGEQVHHLQPQIHSPLPTINVERFEGRAGHI
jgi:hypothetical protein